MPPSADAALNLGRSLLAGYVLQFFKLFNLVTDIYLLTSEQAIDNLSNKRPPAVRPLQRNNPVNFSNVYLYE